jgi:hypothetical protein
LVAMLLLLNWRRKETMLQEQQQTVYDLPE